MQKSRIRINSDKTIIDFFRTSKYFRYSVIFLIVYEISIMIVKPANGSFLKLIITLFFVGSFINLLFYFKSNIKNVKRAFKPIYFIFIILLGLGIVNIIRSIESNSQSLITLFGNRDTGLAMLLPMVIVLGLKLNNIIWFNQICLKILKIGLFVLPLSFLNHTFLEISLYLFSFYLIPLTLFVYQSKSAKLIILLSTISLFIIQIYSSGRLTVLQILFLWMSVLFFFIYEKTKLKYVRNLVILSLVSFPFIIIISGIPFFEYLNQSNNVEIGAINNIDTRTFLYTEVISDLQKNESMGFGKGALGTYNSPYFAQGVEGGDNENRLNVEVGFLSMLLKGGIINMILNFMILFIAVFLAFKSKNKLTQRLSFLVICHILSLFIADIPQYTTMSFSSWIAIGACISLAIREKLENEIVLKFRKVNNNPN